jgi:hypothetical protein
VTNYVAGINKYICEAQPLRPDCSAAQRRQIEGNNGSSPAEKLPGGYGAIAPNGLPGEQPLPRLWKVTDVIATASLIGGIFGKGGGREVDAAKVLEEAIARFGGQGRAVFGDFRRAEDAEAPTTASGAFPYRVPPTSVDPDSVGLPDAGTLADSPVLAGSGGSGSGLPGGIFGLLGGASNALLVAADESESGRPVTVFGPQTGYFSPQLLMEIDIHAPPSRAANGSPRQGIDARGATFAGVNLYVQLGRGRNYAWSATSAGQDIVDTFALELCDPPGGATDGYRFRGSCLEFEVLERQNQWFPNGADQSAPGSETLTTRRSKLGLEVARGEIGGVPHVYVLLRSTYFHEADSALGFVDFNDPERMATPEGFEQAASKIGFTFNWFYANRDDVAYFNSGNNPVRKGASDPSFPVRACPDESDPCDFEWQGWDPDSTGASPNKFVADYTPLEQHPQTLNPAFITSWNNKQAPQYRAADDNFSYGPVHRSQPLDDRIRAGIAGGAKMSLAELVDAMEDAGTVDLRGDKVLPFALRVLRSEPESDAALRDAITALDAWRAEGAHRRDRDDDGVYEHSGAIKIMDAWWPRWIEAQFKPALGAGLYDALVSMMGLDDEPGPIGSAYINGWYGYAQKDLRTLLGDDPPDSFSRTYCGAADQSDTASLAKCRAVLRDALADAVAASEASVYPDGSCEDEDGSQQSAQYCQDAIEHTAVGAITQPPIHWVNRPTFQQAVEVGARRAQGTGVKDEPEEGETLASGPQDAPDVGGNARRRVPAPSASGDLPFTGFLVAVVALAGAAALLGGRALRRRLR